MPRPSSPKMRSCGCDQVGTATRKRPAPAVPALTRAGWGRRRLCVRSGCDKKDSSLRKDRAPVLCMQGGVLRRLPMYKTLLLSAAFLGASVIGAAAQSSQSPSPSGGGNISAATHCKDKATGQARLKTAGSPSGSTTGAAGSMSGSTSGSTGSSAAGSAGSSPGTAPPVAANLPDCP